MNETITSNHPGITLGYSGNINGYIGNPTTTITNGSGLTLASNSSINYSNNLGLSQAVANSNNMNRQTKVAVFTVERNEDNKVTSSKFVKEIWVEVKNGASLELSVAKQLDKDFDPSTTIIKELSSVTF
jgi:hypothetical protein